MSIRKSLVSLALAGVLVTGIGATPALASGTTDAPRATAASSVESSLSPAAVRPASLPVDAAHKSITSASEAESRGLGSLIVAAIKKVPGLFSTIGKAVKKGYTAFAVEWRKVPAWIRVLAGDLSASAIYDLIKGFF